MKALRNPRELLLEARGLEQAGKLPEAAAVYRQLLDTDPLNQQAVTRLLTVYRRLKEPRKELAALDSVLSVYAQKDKASQAKWLTAHPQAAKASRAFLRSLGNSTASGFGVNPVVGRLLKRKELVEKKLYGKKAGGKPSKTVKKNDAAEKKAVEAAARRKVAEDRKREAREKRTEAARKKAEEAAARKAAKAEAAAKATADAKAAAKVKAAADAEAAAAATTTLFIVTLRYLVSLEKIDAATAKHNAFLDKHFAAGNFLVAGSQVPQTGAVIVARGKSRVAIERIMKQDPLLQRKLASLDIVEFSVSKLDKKQWRRNPERALACLEGY